MRLLSVLWRWASAALFRVVAGTSRETPTSGTGSLLVVARKNRHLIPLRKRREVSFRSSRTVVVRATNGGLMKFEIKDTKTTSENLDYIIDFTEELRKRGQSGEDDTISSVAWTVPSTMTYSGAYYTDFFCGIFLASGTVGRNNVDALITTTAGRVYDVRLVITVKNN